MCCRLWAWLLFVVRGVGVCRQEGKENPILQQSLPGAGEGPCVCVCVRVYGAFGGKKSQSIR